MRGFMTCKYDFAATSPSIQPSNHSMNIDLEQADRLAHGGLNVEGLDVLPVLLEQRHEEVDACTE